MKTNKVFFFVGGSGIRAAIAFMLIARAELENPSLRDNNNFDPIVQSGTKTYIYLVELDRKNPNATKVSELVDSYNTRVAQLGNIGNKFGRIICEDIKLSQDNTEVINLQTRTQITDRDLLKVLFTSEQLNDSLNGGTHGVAKTTRLLANEFLFTPEKMEQYIPTNLLTNPNISTRVLVVGSVVGGTGSGAIPSLLYAINRHIAKCMAPEGAEPQNLSEHRVGLIALLSYFSYGAAEGIDAAAIHVDHTSHVPRTKVALKNYQDNVLCFNGVNSSAPSWICYVGAAEQRQIIRSKDEIANDETEQEQATYNNVGEYESGEDKQAYINSIMREEVYAMCAARNFFETPNYGEAAPDGLMDPLQADKGLIECYCDVDTGRDPQNTNCLPYNNYYGRSLRILSMVAAIYSRYIYKTIDNNKNIEKAAHEVKDTIFEKMKNAHININGGEEGKYYNGMHLINKYMNMLSIKDIGGLSTVCTYYDDESKKAYEKILPQMKYGDFNDFNSLTALMWQAVEETIG